MNDHAMPQYQRVVSIRTPENIELAYALAGPGSRAAAYLFDVLVMMIVAQILLYPIAFLVGFLIASFGENRELWVSAIMSLLAFALYNGYFVLLEWLMNGQTPGKRVLHIRVIKQGGYALHFFDTLLRNLLRAIDFLPLFYGVGLTSLLLTRESQRVGDLVAGTLVVYQEPVETDALVAELPALSDAEPELSASQLAQVPNEVIVLAAEYLRSRGELAPRPRQEVAAELVQVIRATSGLEPRPGQGVEGFLTALVRQVERIPPSLDPSPEEEAAEFLS